MLLSEDFLTMAADMKETHRMRALYFFTFKVDKRERHPI